MDAETGAAVPRVRVGSYGPSRPRSTGSCISVPTDEKGAYRMRVAPGSSYVYYQGGTAEYPFSEEGSFEIDVAEGQTVKAPDLRVKRVEPIIIQVVGPDGAPVPNAEIAYYTDWHTPSQADAEGKCTIYGVRPGRPIVVTASDADGKLSGATIVEGAKPQETVTVTLDRPARITFRLLDQQGEPLPGLTVQLALTAQARKPEGLGPLEAFCHAAIAKATSDEAGEVRFESLAAGVTPEVFFTEKTASPPEWPEIPLLKPGATHDLGDVLIDLRTMSVRGTVVLADGSPVNEARVTINRWGSATVHTDEDGRFELPGLLPRETVLVVAASPDRKFFGAETVVPEWELEPAITLTPPVRIVGVLIGQDGRPVPRRPVQVDTVVGGGADGFATRGEASTDDNGAFMFEPVVPGTEYRLSVPDAKGKQWFLIHTFTVAPGADCALGLVKLPDFVKP